MLYSTKWVLKQVFKGFVALIVIVLISSNVNFRDHKHHKPNVTITSSTPSPEEELKVYIKTISSWQHRNNSKIINPHPYKYLYNPSTVCKSGGATSDPLLLIVVKSFVSNIGNREAIRITWGKGLHPAVKLVFMLGHIDLMDPYIQIESKRYNDVIQENFVDVYWNNTLKTIMGFNWVVSNCKETSYVLFVDDDYLVNVPNILQYVQDHQKKGQVGLYGGYLWEKAYPKRSNTSKWYVSLQDFPCQRWPDYVGGGSFLVSMDVASKMSAAFPHIKPIFIDDVYLGIVAATVDVKPIMLGQFCPDYHPNKIEKLFSTHGVHSSNLLIQDWERVKHKVNLNYT